MSDNLNRKEAIEYLEIPEKHFDNYFKNSKEIPSNKGSNGRWIFKKDDLDKWDELRNKRTVHLNMSEYEKCFIFAIKMAYSSGNRHGTGIRGARSEVQTADDFILGILAEHGVKKLLSKKFGVNIKLDMKVHPDHITPQDFDGIYENRKVRECRIGVAVKSSKTKSCFNIIHPLEYEESDRNSDAYIFVRVGLPSDHLFRILRKHSFFREARKFLDSHDDFNTISKLDKIPIWITGFNYPKDFHKVKEIAGQKFSGSSDYRYVVSVSEMRNSDKDWKKLINKL